MKKSEIIVTIAEYLVEPHFDDPYKEAEYILDKLIKIGMLPPSRPRKRGEYPELTDGQYKKFFNDSSINAWEEE